MSLNLSVLKNIDFTNSDNFLFFSIVLIFAIILFFVISTVIFELFFVAKKIFHKISSKGIETKKQVDTTNIKNIEEIYVAKKPKLVGGDFSTGIKTTQKLVQEIKKDVVIAEKEKEAKNISGQLDKLKEKKSTVQENSLEAKMLSINKNQDQGQDYNSREKIEIPTKKNIVAKESGVQGVVMSTQKDNNLEKVQIEQGKRAQEHMESLGLVNPIEPGKEEEKINREEKTLPYKNLNISESPQKPEPEVLKPINTEPKDTTIFKGRDSLKMKEAVWKMTRRTAPLIKGGLGGNYTLKERQEIAKKISDFKKFGGLLQKSDRARIYRTLAKEKLSASPSERMKIIKQERFLKNIIGK